MRAGISEVVAAVADPNPLVPGGGLARLQQAGLKVRVGDGEEEALALNQAFFTWSRHHRPWITLKAAMTLDGKVADRSGASKYLTSAPALKHAHALRREHDAILVGSGTILADNPRLTYRGAARGRDPIRVVLDTRGRISSQAEVFCVNSDAPTLVFTAETTDVDWERALFSVGAEVIRVASGPDGHVWLPEVIAHLADRRILSVLVEGGPTTHAAFLAHQLADRWVGYMAPRILGGTEAPSSVGGHGFLLAQAPPLIINRVMRRGADVIIDALFVPATPVSLPGQAEHQIASQGVS